MITVIESQSLLDIALQENGNVLSAFDFAIANKIDVMDVLVPGQKLIEVKSDVDLKEVSDYFKGKGQLIATCPAELPEEIFNYGFPEGEFPFSF
ncbi:hypothetical protein [Flavobacterium sp. N1994]|uniref:hypothetical protein n=1 Tax=Flavobacterium sp. N1994 TaxID=2986827 RepID=UPI0022217485|nr:hypothetical protein [Flavobacterium sp. N1994]